MPASVSFQPPYPMLCPLYIKTLVKRQEVLQKIMNQESLGEQLVQKIKKISEIWFLRLVKIMTISKR